jgi:hypothetical protein
MPSKPTTDPLLETNTSPIKQIMITMKNLRLSLLTAASLLVAAGASAQINFHIAGAVSLQDVTYNTLVGLYGGNLVSENLSAPTKPTTASVFTMTGQMTGLFGSQTVNVYVNWSGSGAAIQSLTGNGTVNFYASPNQGVTNLVAATVDVGGSVVYQADYPYPSPVLNDSTYGVTPTIFARSPQVPATITNITSQQIRYIEANGSAPESLFTGNAADTNVIYWIMRDIGAAHRIISADEAGFTGNALGYYYTNGAWTLDTVGRTSWPLILSMITNYDGPCLTFLPPNQAANINPANILSFNGSFPFRGTFSTVANDYTPTINGQYTCWGFEHVMTAPTANANIIAFAAALESGIQSNMVTSPYSIPLPSAHVTRSSTGGLVTPN